MPHPENTPDSPTTVIRDHSAHPEDKRQQIAEVLRTSLIAFNLSKTSSSPLDQIVLTVEISDKILGGVVGRIAWDWLHLELLWLNESLRGQGYGKTLVGKAEHLARKKGCLGVHLDTFSFQAPDFYQRLGYEIFGRIDNHPRGQTRYFLKKTF